jgi:response regulator RpfG family c-di-GMP phosphodiesterase
MTDEYLPRVLCVDDEPRVLEGLALHLRRRFQLFLAASGDEALEKLKAVGGAAVVVSDMRMPGMNGAVLLAKVRNLYPDAIRILLTGEPGRDTLVSAVNSGQIFRFLTKPCPPDELIASVQAAVEQHRLITSERILLQETLIGCIHSLVDVLALTNPVAFGRASRLRRQALAFAEHLGCAQGFWQLEAAAMLSQIGYLSLPAELVEKVYYGERLTPEEETLNQGVPEVASKLLHHVPRLEPVVQILNSLNYSTEQLQQLGHGPVGRAARILRIVTDFDGLTSQGNGPDIAMQVLRSREERYGAELVKEFATHLGAGSGEMQVVEMLLRLVRPGMTILQDVRTYMGTLLVPRGFEVTERFIERMPNFGPELLNEKVQVRIPASRAAGAGV